MAKKTSLDDLAIQLDKLTEAELLSARSIIDALLEVKAFPSSSPSAGHIEVKMISDKKRGKTYGPYRYLRYWLSGKLLSRYLGKVESDFQRMLQFS